MMIVFDGTMTTSEVSLLKFGPRYDQYKVHILIF